MSAEPSQSGFYPIESIKLPKDPDLLHHIPVRQEVNKWFKDPANAIQVSLYLQALDKFQQKPWGEKLSYFQIAGIHGFPAQVWDNGGTHGFYCAHQLPTFPTWHRVYLTLYEQCLHGCMLEIIKETVPDSKKAEWTGAASRWRLPFWDYAVEPSLPDIATSEIVDVLNPKGGTPLRLDPNPMHKYLFSKENPTITMGDKSLSEFAISDNNGHPWSECKGTSRHAITKAEVDPSKRWIKGISNNKKVNQALFDHEHPPKRTGTIKENVYRLFTDGYLRSWRTFASTKYYARTENIKDWLSLEQIHNMIHLWTGGDQFGKPDPKDPDNANGIGHMMDVPVAAFDPIFWLHHCFIDRLAAIWQEINDDRLWFDHPLPEDSRYNPKDRETFKWKADPKPDEPLYPFHKKEATPDADYTSNDVRNWKLLNYQYEILEAQVDDYKPDGTLDRVRYLQHVWRDLNRLYSTTRTEVLSAIDDGVRDLEKHNYDYMINITYNRYGLDEGKPYVIHLFVGPIGDEGQEAKSAYSYRTHPNRVGSVFTFSSPFETASGRVTCSNCKQQAEGNVLSTAQIPITGALIKDAVDKDNSDLASLLKDRVELYLKQELRWKAFTITGEVIPAASLPDLAVAAFVGKGFHDQNPNTLSKYEDYSPLFDATKEQEGGAKNTVFFQQMYGLNGSD